MSCVRAVADKFLNRISQTLSAEFAKPKIQMVSRAINPQLELPPALAGGSD